MFLYHPIPLCLPFQIWKQVSSSKLNNFNYWTSEKKKVTSWLINSHNKSVKDPGQDMRSYKLCKCQVQRYSLPKETGVCVLKVYYDLWSNRHITPSQNVLGLIFHCLSSMYLYIHLLYPMQCEISNKSEQRGLFTFVWGINTKQLTLEANLLISLTERRTVVKRRVRSNCKDVFIPSIQNTEKMSFAVTIWHHQLDALRN